LLGAPPLAAADSVEECIEAFESAQVERDAGRLTAARSMLEACSSEQCPGAIAQDCRKWLFEIDRRIPTLVLGAKAPDGSDLAAVRVYVDGRLLVSRLDGRSVRVDPGEHALRWVHADHAPVEKRLIVREGEQNRSVRVVFGVEPPHGEAPGGDAPVSDGRAVPLGAWIAGGVGVGGLVAFAVIGSSVASREEELLDTCAPNCGAEEVDSLEDEALLANVALGVGVVGVAVAAWLALASDPTPSSSATGSVGFGPTRGGGMGWFSTRF
jgi:hypothetical protein